MKTATIAASVLLFAAGAASAQTVSPLVVSTHPDARSVNVAYGDLNLDSDAGMKRLGDRLRAATRSVCGWQTERLLVVEASRKACYEGALASAWGQVVAARSQPALAKSQRVIQVAQAR